MKSKLSKNKKTDLSPVYIDTVLFLIEMGEKRIQHLENNGLTLVKWYFVILTSTLPLFVIRGTQGFMIENQIVNFTFFLYLLFTAVFGSFALSSIKKGHDEYQIYSKLRDFYMDIAVNASFFEVTTDQGQSKALFEFPQSFLAPVYKFMTILWYLNIIIFIDYLIYILLPSWLFFPITFSLVFLSAIFYKVFPYHEYILSDFDNLFRKEKASKTKNDD